MNSDSFIGRHGLVRYTERLGRRYPRTGKCDVGACQLIRRQDDEQRASLAAEGRVQLGQVLDDLAAIAGHRAVVLGESPADDKCRRARRRKLDHARLRRIALDAERDRLVRQLDRYAVAALWAAEHAERLAARPLMFDHCHVHGWVRGLACHDCNVLLGAADAGRLTAGDSTWALAVLAFRRNCPDCCAASTEGKP